MSPSPAPAKPERIEFYCAGCGPASDWRERARSERGLSVIYWLVICPPCYVKGWRLIAKHKEIR